MVRALLDGAKTQTRRLATSPLRRCQSGDRLWVRENWYCDHVDCQKGPYLQPASMSLNELVDDGFLHFKATTDDRIWECGVPPYRPSIHMPRWASRLTLEVEAVRIEPLHNISDADALAEGVVRVRDHCFVARGTAYDRSGLCHSSPSTAYACLWSELHGADSWSENPDVVVLTFKPVVANIDSLATLLAA